MGVKTSEGTAGQTQELPPDAVAVKELLKSMVHLQRGIEARMADYTVLEHTTRKIIQEFPCIFPGSRDLQ